MWGKNFQILQHKLELIFLAKLILYLKLKNNRKFLFLCLLICSKLKDICDCLFSERC